MKEPLSDLYIVIKYAIHQTHGPNKSAIMMLNTIRRKRKMKMDETKFCISGKIK